LYYLSSFQKKQEESNIGFFYESSFYSTVYSIIIDPLNKNILYICTNNGIYKSTDCGQIWDAINLNYCKALQIDLNGVLYGGGHGMVFISRDK